MVAINYFYLCLFLIYFSGSNSDAYRILVIAPLNSKSHSNLFESVAKALALNGHQVDVISHFELTNPPNNYKTIINLNGTIPSLENNFTIEIINTIQDDDFVPAVAQVYGNNYCQLLSQEILQEFIAKQSKDHPYDLVITEALGANCYFGFEHVLKVPVVIVSALTHFLWFDEILGNPMSNAFAVNIEMKDSRIVTFWDRLKNHFWVHYGNYRFFKYTEESQTTAMRKYLSPDIPNIREIEKKTALLLVNTHHSLFGVKPLVPAIVQIAGIQIEQNEAKITPELKVWMDESTHGVVYFTLGSMVHIEEFSKEILLEIYSAFAKLAPIRILMKIVNKDKLPPGLPKNVLTMSWIPQIPVLRHENTKVFMTHGGINSVHEALFFAVPMIGFPLFADQPLNIRLLSNKNVAYEMNYKEITEKSLTEALNGVLYNPKYHNAARRESRFFRDRPMNATETAVFWIEYVIRNGANSLRSPSIDMPWWRSELVDIYAFLFISILLVSYIAFFILRKITYFICTIFNSSSGINRKMN